MLRKKKLILRKMNAMQPSHSEKEKVEKYAKITTAILNTLSWEQQQQQRNSEYAIMGWLII
jgi:hypothetical protein